MSRCSLPLVIEPGPGEAAVFQIECMADVEYSLDHGTLEDFEITDFRFPQHAYRWSAAKAEYVAERVSEWRATGKVREALLLMVDYEKLREELLEHLSDEGELADTTAQLRADYHASVL